MSFDVGARGCVRQVTGLLSQGRGEGNEWVTAFLVSYSLDAYHWLYITDQYGNQRVNKYTPIVNRILYGRGAKTIIIIIISAKAREHVFTGVGLCVCVCV